MNARRPVTIARCFMGVVLAGLAWRLLRYFLNFDLSGDEACILSNVLARSYRQLLNPLDYSQVSPPGFLWVTKFCDSLFGNEWGVRLVPVLAGVGGMVVFWKLCVQVLRGTARWVAWAVFSASYVPVEEGACSKGYTIDLLAALVMLWLMLRWLRGGRNARELAWLGLCAPVFVWFSYTSVFVVGAIGLVFAAHCLNSLLKYSAERRVRARGLQNFLGHHGPCRPGAPTGRILQQAVKARGSLGRGNLTAGIVFMALAVSSAVWLYAVNIRPSLGVSQTSGLRDFWQMGYPPVDHPWRIPFWLLEAHTGRGFAWPVGGNHFGSTLTTVLWLAGLAIYWRRGNRDVLALFVMPHVLLLAAAFLHKYPYGANPRICMFLGPGICLFMGAGAQYLAARLGHGRGRRFYRVGAAALMCIVIGGATRGVALRIREINGPDIRSTFVEAGRVVGADGQFVVLPGEASQIADYYMRRHIVQPIGRLGEAGPAQLRSGSKLAVLRIATEHGALDWEPFDEFEAGFGKPMALVWTRVARLQPAAKEPEVSVRIYEIGASTR